jgi:hypothetical protein
VTDLLGALLTLLALGILGLCGYLLALLLMGERAAEDTLELAVASLLGATGVGVGIGLVLGAVGELRIELALPLALALAGILWAVARRRAPADAVGHPLKLLLRRAGGRLRAHPALALLSLHAVGAEFLRGLFRPPLSWDSLMYHLPLTATWLQRHDLAPVYGAYPMSYYGYVPANGSVWLWWWMAPSHGDLYANLAFLPQWLLLVLATGAVARRLGAERSWPLAAFLVGITPTVVRFAATQYVDIFTAACLVAAVACGLRWLRRPEPGDAALAGAGLGLAAGAKVLGLMYGGALAAALLLFAVWRAPDGARPVRRRALQMTLALVVALALGGFFYLRNAALGVGPLALACEGLPHRPTPGLPSLPRPDSVAALPHRMFAQGELFRAFLGSVDARSQFIDLGIGPQALLILLAVPALFLLGRGRRREGWVAGSQVVFEVVVWATVPYAASGHVEANVRYLLPALGLALAGGVAAAEGWGVGEGALNLLSLGLAAQDLLQLHTAFPDNLRSGVAAADVLAAALLVSPALRGWLRRHAALAAAACGVAALAAVPSFAHFRDADRARAFLEEFTAHVTSTPRYARAWKWLDQNGGTGAVDVVSAPDTFFVYPAMGRRLERPARYVNVNQADLHAAADYPLCQPRNDLSPVAWLVNVRREGVRWLLLSRKLPFDFPPEADWARARPDLFALRYQDSNNVIFEVLQAPASGASPASTIPITNPRAPGHPSP